MIMSLPEHQYYYIVNVPPLCIQEDLSLIQHLTNGDGGVVVPKRIEMDEEDPPTFLYNNLHWPY